MIMRKRKNRIDSYIIKKVLFFIDISYFNGSEPFSRFVCLEKVETPQYLNNIRIVLSNSLTRRRQGFSIDFA